MTRKQRKRKHERRRAHRATVGVPRNVLHRETYTAVKKGHIVPVVYQRSFAVDNMVCVHVDGRRDGVLMNVRDAGARSRFYRRSRPDGSDIDDYEATLSVLEEAAAPALRAITSDGRLTDERKGLLCQFFGMQMVRGPAFFEKHANQARATIERELRETHLQPGVLEQAGGDLSVARQEVIRMYTQPTQRLMSMTKVAQKLAAALGSMKWQLLIFDAPVLAYSDQPIVVWPQGTGSLAAPPTKPPFGPLTALEVRVPLSPELAVLMTWADKPDAAEPLAVPADIAGELNALTVGQADKQWMHSPSAEPPIQKGAFEPLALRLEPGYDAQAAGASVRRATVTKYLHRVRNKQFLNDIELVNVTLRGS